MSMISRIAMRAARPTMGMAMRSAAPYVITQIPHFPKHIQRGIIDSILKQTTGLHIYNRIERPSLWRNQKVINWNIYTN